MIYFLYFTHCYYWMNSSKRKKGSDYRWVSETTGGCWRLPVGVGLAKSLRNIVYFMDPTTLGNFVHTIFRSSICTGSSFSRVVENSRTFQIMIAIIVEISQFQNVKYLTLHCQISTRIAVCVRECVTLRIIKQYI